MNSSVPTTLSPDDRHRGRVNAYASQAVGVQLELMIASSAIGPLFIKKLGGSDLQAMLPSVLMGFLFLVQIPVSLWIHPRDGKRFLVRCWLAAPFCMAAGIAASALLDPSARTTWLVLGTIVAMQFCLCLGGTFWYPLLHDVVAVNERGRFFGFLRAIWSSIFFAVVLAAGVFLGNSPPLWKFQLVIGIAALMQLARNRFLVRIPQVSHADATTAGSNPSAWREVLQPKVLAFCGYYVVLTFLAGFLGQPLVLFMKSMGFPVRDNVVVFGMVALGSTVMLLFAGWLVDHIGTRRVFLAVHAVMCLLALTVATTAALPSSAAKAVLVFVLVLAGACFSSAELASTAQLFHMAPERGKPLFMSLVTAMTYLGGALSPLTAGLILDSPLGRLTIRAGNAAMNIYQIIFVVAGIGLLLAIGLLHFVEDVRGRDQDPSGDGAPPSKTDAMEGGAPSPPRDKG